MNWLHLAPMLVLVSAPGATVPSPLAHTFSIVARDSATGDFGVAVQSHYFSVGPVVPWAEAGVGAVATQSLVLVDYGPNGLALMRGGMSARQALDSLLKADAHNEGRQVAMVDAKGTVAAYTGKACIPDAGHHTGAGYSVQANLMANDRIWPAMAEAYEHAQGDLAERMLQALEAAQKAGGDIRGKQSAAILVVRAQSTGMPWKDWVYNLRVEDNEEPIKELRRLVRLQRAYLVNTRGDDFLAAKDSIKAMEAYEQSMKMAPEVVELQFWAALTMYTNGREADGLRLFREVFARERVWADLIPRLAKVGLFPDDPKKIDEVEKQKPHSRMDRGR
ncbi:MAG: DUF1028 domain-containing protein [Candidatus Eisenbacteria bacterium]|nr:DUF1028 domain-containing protein [Candidatus Eisenbacteria bacterium]